jgi:hypothetical protein
MHVSMVALNRVWWGGGGWLVMTIVLLHFPELEVELELLGSGYNADLSCDEMETLWTRTCLASIGAHKTSISCANMSSKCMK